MNRKIVTVMVAAAASISLTACGSEWDQAHNHNAPVGPYETPNNSVVELPYNWNNIARVCERGEGIYEAFKGTAIYVVPNDPNCPQPSASPTAKPSS